MLRHSVFIVETNQTMEEKISDDNTNLNLSFSPENSESEHEEKKEDPGNKVNPDLFISPDENSKGFLSSGF